MDAQTTVGAAISAGCLFVAEKMEMITVHFLHIQMPPIIMDCAQLFAWLAGGVAGCVTIFSWYEKRKNRTK